MAPYLGFDPAPKPLGTFFQRLGFGSLPIEKLKARYASPLDGSKFIEVNGFNIHYRDEGSRSKPVIVLLHGVSASLHTWNDWTAALLPHYRVVRLDSPCFGLTGIPRADVELSMTLFIDTIVAFLDRLELPGPLTLAGSSLGGYVAWNIALRTPSKVAKLVLISPAGYKMRRVPPFIALSELPGMLTLSKYLSPRSLIRSGTRNVYGDARKLAPAAQLRYVELAQRELNGFASTKLFRLICELNRKGLDEAPKKIQRLDVPTLLLWGSEDRWISPEQAEEWSRDVHGLKAILYSGVGHIAMEEEPDLTVRDALDFLLERE